MDNRTGEFVPIAGEMMRVGDEVEFKGLKFRIEKVEGDRVEVRTVRSIEHEEVQKRFHDLLTAAVAPKEEAADDDLYPCGHQKSAGGIEQHDCKE